MSTEPEPRSDLALEFLQRYSPEGPWVLTAISTKRDFIQTRTFIAGDKAIMKWLEEHNGKNNLYFHVNPVTHAMSKKAEREDIAALAWLHVDIDPRPGEDIEKEQERAFKILQHPPKNVPPPTVIIFSGGGYQGFWRLKSSLEINGDLSRAEDVKRYNLQLEIIFGADNCHNVDRIMRLPGTINLPDAKKKKKGRKPALAKLVEFHNERAYDISQFTAAPILQSEEDGGTRPVTVKLSGNIDRVNLDDLDIPDRLKMIIVQGHDPDAPKKGDNSRSAWIFDCVCNLIRANITDEQIFSIITDRDFGISSSVLEKPRPESYAIRQIERAHEDAIHPLLRELNDKHAVIADLGGKCRVIQEVFDAALHRSRISKQTFEDFRNRYMHRKVDLGLNEKNQPIEIPLGKWWLSHVKRRQYETLVFSPGRTVEGAYNLWRGFSCEAIPGKWDSLKEHIFKNVCAGDGDNFKYLLGWMARAIQQPDCPGEVAVVMRGKMGTGKGFFAKEFGKLWGRHYMQITDPKHLIGNFNSHLRDAVVLFADEAFYAGDVRHASILKGLITEESISIEAKGVDVENSPNFIHLMMASNDDWVVPAGLDERRFFVLDVGEAQKQNTEYFARISNDMEKKGGRQAMLHELMNMDLSGYEVRKVPQTEALREQKQFSMRLEVQWWFEKLEEGRLLPSHSYWEGEVQKSSLMDDYVLFAQKTGAPRRHSPTTLGRFLNKVCPEGFPYGFQKTTDVSFQGRNGEELRKSVRVYFYRMPSLLAARSHFDGAFGGPYKWAVEETAPDRKAGGKAAKPSGAGQQGDIPY